MMSDASGQLFYVYGIVRDGFDVARAPAGVEDSPVTLVKRGTVAALVSRLPRGAYSPAHIETNSGDVNWLSPRAMAHDRVLTWAHDHGGVLPLPMFSMWGSEDALLDSLASQTVSLERVFDRVRNAEEYGLRVHRRDDEMLATVTDLDPEIAELQRAAREASPGQKYLLERKVAEQSKRAVRIAGQRIAKEIFEALKAKARAAVARPLVPDQTRASDATMVLNAAFLVDREGLDAFRAAVGAHQRAHEGRGLAFDFTGPWPPYNFVGERGEAPLRVLS